jgi:hypothetical protein
MALGSTQSLTEIRTRDLSGDKGDWRLGLTNLPPTCADFLEILGATTSRKSKGLPSPVV